MRRAFRFRVYPTSGQAARMAVCLRDHQRMYNAALEERREAWRRCQVSISYGSQSAHLRDIRAGDPDQARWSFSSQQATLRRLDKAIQAFYRRCKAGQTPGYPRFRAVDRWDSAEWPCDGDGCKWQPGAQFAGILAGKAEEAGRRIVLVNPACTSIDCHACGARCTRPRQDTVICPVHGAIDADLNAARNIYARAGLGSGQAAPAA